MIGLHTLYLRTNFLAFCFRQLAQIVQAIHERFISHILLIFGLSNPRREYFTPCGQAVNLQSI